MSEQNNQEAPKKLSLQELMQQKLEAKKNANSSGKGSAKGDQSTKKLATQNSSKKTNMTRRKMGS
jgi:hypothetical protein